LLWRWRKASANLARHSTRSGHPVEGTEAAMSPRTAVKMSGQPIDVRVINPKPAATMDVASNSQNRARPLFRRELIPAPSTTGTIRKKNDQEGDPP
jgi:hypothetical protein